MQENKERVIVFQIHEQDNKGNSNLLDTLWLLNPEVLKAWRDGLAELIDSFQGIKLEKADKAVLREAKIISRKLETILFKIDPETYLPPVQD